MTSVDDASEQEPATPTVSLDKAPTAPAPTTDAEPPEPADSAPDESVPAAPRDPWAPPTADTVQRPVPTPPQGPIPAQIPGQFPGPMPMPYPGGPYPGGPGGPYPGPYGPYGWQPPVAPPQGVNGFAVAAAVLGIGGFVCCLWAPAIGFGIAALRQIRRTGQKGRGLAITGLVMSGVWLTVIAVVLALGLAAGRYRTTPLQDNGAGQVLTSDSFLQLTPGDCFDRIGSGKTAVRPTSCTGPHDGEAMGPTQLAGVKYPGDAAVKREGSDGCDQVLSTYVLDTWTLPTSVDVHFFYLPGGVWDPTGANFATCFLVSGSHTKLTGALRSDRTTLTTDQYAYLTAVDKENAVKAPDADPVEDPAANRLWAGEEADAVAEEIRALEGHSWDAATTQPIAAFVAELKKILPHLRAAQQSTDTDTLSSELDQADHDLTPQAKAVRATLGLATSRAGTNTTAQQV